MILRISYGVKQPKCDSCGLKIKNKKDIVHAYNTENINWIQDVTVTVCKYCYEKLDKYLDYKNVHIPDDIDWGENQDF